MRDLTKPDLRPAWLKACDDLKKTVVQVEPKPVIYKAHPVGPRPVRVKKGFLKKPKTKQPSTPRQLKRANPDLNPMPAFVGRMVTHYRTTGRATPKADARRAEKASS